MVQTFIFFKVISTGVLHVRLNERKSFLSLHVEEYKSRELVIHCGMHFTIRFEVKRAQPLELSFLPSYHPSVKQWRICVDPIDQRVAYQAGRESRDF